MKKWEENMQNDKNKSTQEHGPIEREPKNTELNISGLKLEKRTKFALALYNITHLNVLKSTRVEICRSNKQKIIDRITAFNSSTGAEKDARGDLIEAVVKKVPGIIVSLVGLTPACYYLFTLFS